MGAPKPSQITHQPIKVWLSFSDQVDLFVKRELRISPLEKENLRTFLQQHNYYRFSGYFKQFYLPEQGGEYFAKDQRLRQLIDVYLLDGQVRLLVFEGIQVLEILIKTAVAYHFTCRGKDVTEYAVSAPYRPERPDNNPPAGMDAIEWKEQHKALTKSRDALLTNVKDILNREEIFLKHYSDNNRKPPLWAAIEALSLGDVSRMVSLWKDTNSVDAVANDLGFSSAAELKRALGNINYFRNIAAHHGRIWGRTLTRPVAKPKWRQPVGRSHWMVDECPAQILVLLSEWVDHVQGNNVYSQRLWALVESNVDYRRGVFYPKL